MINNDDKMRFFFNWFQSTHNMVFTRFSMVFVCMCVCCVSKWYYWIIFYNRTEVLCIKYCLCLYLTLLSSIFLLDFHWTDDNKGVTVDKKLLGGQCGPHNTYHSFWRHQNKRLHLTTFPRTVNHPLDIKLGHWIELIEIFLNESDFYDFFMYGEEIFYCCSLAFSLHHKFHAVVIKNTLKKTKKGPTFNYCLCVIKYCPSTHYEAVVHEKGHYLRLIYHRTEFWMEYDQLIII